MSKIKSAWEIALERTENIEVDREKLKRKEEEEKIRRIIGQYLSSDNAKEFDIKKKLKDFDQKDVREAITITVLNRLSLPQDEVTDDRYTRLATLIELVAPNSSEVNQLFSGIEKFLKQYPIHRKQLIDQLKNQAEPALREKEDKLREAYGESVHLNLEDDKEFLEILKQNLDRLNQMYEKEIDGAKEDLKKLLNSPNI